MNRQTLTSDALVLKEQFFECGRQVLRPVNLMIGDSYAASKRDKNHPLYDPDVAAEYDKAMWRAKTALYEQRNLVQNVHLPRFEVIKCARQDALSDAAEELRSLLSDGCLDRLAEVLCGNSPILVAQRYVEGVQTAVLRVAEQEKARLNELMRGYFVRRIPGAQKLNEELD